MNDGGLLESLIRRLVSKPDAVTVQARYADNTTYFLVTTAPEDVGKVIGKKGRTADALRHVFMAVAAQENRRVFLDIANPNEG